MLMKTLIAGVGLIVPVLWENNREVDKKISYMRLSTESLAMKGTTLVNCSVGVVTYLCL